MDLNYGAILLATAAQFIIGAIWYMPIFGDAWGKMHGFDKLSKKEQEEARKGMTPYLIIQLVVTFVTTVVLAKFIDLLPEYSAYTLAAMIWIGFFVPVQAAAIIFGGTEEKYMLRKALIMAGGSLACLMAAAAILSNF